MKRGLFPQHAVSSLPCSHDRLWCLSLLHQAKGAGGLAPGFHQFGYGFRGGTLLVRQIRGTHSIGCRSTPVRVHALP